MPFLCIVSSFFDIGHWKKCSFYPNVSCIVASRCFLTLGALLSLSGVEENIHGAVLTEPSSRWLLKCACAWTLLFMSERDLQLRHYFCPSCVRCRTELTVLLLVARYIRTLSFKGSQTAEQCGWVLSGLAWCPLEKCWSWSRLWLFSFADHAAGLMSRPRLLQNVGTHSAIL